MEGHLVQDRHHIVEVLRGETWCHFESDAPAEQVFAIGARDLPVIYRLSPAVIEREAAAPVQIGLGQEGIARGVIFASTSVGSRV